MLDGCDLREYDVESNRSLLGVVEQDVFLFDGTIADNITYARRDVSPSDVHAAAEAAHATEFIDRLSGGMNTLIGERGVRPRQGGYRRVSRAMWCPRPVPRIINMAGADDRSAISEDRIIPPSSADRSFSICLMFRCPKRLAARSLDVSVRQL